MPQAIAELGNGVEMKFYYNKKVYDPNYSSIELPMVANTFIFGNIRLLDVACGCGVTGLILKRIHAGLDVTLTDVDPEAVRITRLNAKRLGLSVSVLEADLIPDDTGNYHIITANLPTYDDEQMAMEELHGPDVAYDGGKDGMDLYRRLFETAKERCVVLCCEVQSARQESFIEVAADYGWKVLERTDMAFALIQNEGSLAEVISIAEKKKLAEAGFTE